MPSPRDGRPSAARLTGTWGPPSRILRIVSVRRKGVKRGWREIRAARAELQHGPLMGDCAAPVDLAGIDRIRPPRTLARSQWNPLDSRAPMETNKVVTAFRAIAVRRIWSMLWVVSSASSASPGIMFAWM